MLLIHVLLTEIATRVIITIVLDKPSRIWAIACPMENADISPMELVLGKLALSNPRVTPLSIRLANGNLPNAKPLKIALI
jgi:hypothetical protein